MSSGAHRVLYFWHAIGNRFLTLFSNVATNLSLTDIETCYKVFRREVLDDLFIEEDRFGFSSLRSPSRSHGVGGASLRPAPLGQRGPEGRSPRDRGALREPGRRPGLVAPRHQAEAGAHRGGEGAALRPSRHSAALLLFWPATALLVVVAARTLRGGSPEVRLRLAVVAAVASGFLLSLALWWSPFGWWSWSPRLSLPLVPAVGVAVFVLTPPDFRPGRPLLLAAAAAVLLAVPQYGITGNSGRHHTLHDGSTACLPVRSTGRTRLCTLHPRPCLAARTRSAARRAARPPIAPRPSAHHSNGGRGDGTRSLLEA